MAEAGANDSGTNPGTPDASPFMLSTGPFGIGKFVSTAQTNFSASDLVSAFGKQDVKVELDTLTAFSKKVEALLLAMEGSEAAPYKLEAQKLEQASFVSANSGSFSEATALSARYEKVHSELVRLHKEFVAQIQAMQDAVSKTAGTYQTNEDHTTAAQNAVAKNVDVTSPPRTKSSASL
ncbi:hypothetical protein [Streptomyces sp. FH025]|uniref:hypothetical protein n=1 Tax=Streptomyces sp. FH025 TaxID=2815937 RepID=UPI001A9DC617|nr:hypothetical protein [Streptomyces sp. FH025]MBO1417526.1 hypothetical protein [Streptomyces sp. FH025]